MNTETDIEKAPVEAGYLDAVVSKKPRRDDEREIIIVGKIREQVFRREWAMGAFASIRELQLHYLHEAISRIDEPKAVYELTQRTLGEIARLFRAEVVEGVNLLEAIPKGQPALVMTNHLGTYKLLGIEPKAELGVDIAGYDFMYPSPAYFASLKPVADAIGNDLLYVSDDFPGVFGSIHREAGFIHVPPKTLQSEGRTGVLLEQTATAFKTRPNSAIVNYPEGGTSGKYNELGPYDLDPFKTGGYVIASQLETRVIPVAQYFDPKHGLRLKIFPPYVPASTDKEANRDRAELDRRGMQEWLDKCQAAHR